MLDGHGLSCCFLDALIYDTETATCDNGGAQHWLSTVVLVTQPLTVRNFTYGPAPPGPDSALQHPLRPLCLDVMQYALFAMVVEVTRAREASAVTTERPQRSGSEAPGARVRDANENAVPLGILRRRCR
jgi:hypothetical protein